jgi:hypothetical protein
MKQVDGRSLSLAWRILEVRAKEFLDFVPELTRRSAASGMNPINFAGP